MNWINKLRSILIFALITLLMFWTIFICYLRMYKNTCEFNFTEAADLWFLLIHLLVFSPLIFDTFKRINNYNDKKISKTVLIPTVIFLIIFAFFFYNAFGSNYKFQQSCTEKENSEIIKFACVSIFTYFVFFPFVSIILNCIETKKHN